MNATGFSGQVAGRAGVRVMDRTASFLVLVDFQSRLMPAINGGGEALANAVRLAEAAELLGVPALATEQNPRGLGPTVPELAPWAVDAVARVHFDSCRELPFIDRLPTGRPLALVAGCEAHVCVLQTAMGLLDRGLEVGIIADAVGSRREVNRAAGLARLAAAGALIVTTEMVLFEWVASCRDPAFKAVLALVK